MEILVENSWSYLKNFGPDKEVIIRTDLSVDTSGFINSWYNDPVSGGPKRGPHWVKSEVCLLDIELRRFPTGLIWRILKSLRDRNIFPVVTDVRNNVVIPAGNPLDICKDIGIDPRDYQLEAVKNILSNKRGILNIATNGGKTEIMALLVRMFPIDTCCLIVSTDLTGLTEVCERFDLRRIHYNRIDANSKTCNLSGVNVCSLDSLRNLEDLGDVLRKCKILMWDECDNSSTSLSSWDIGMNSDAFIRVYLSGTPFTDNPVHNLKLIGVSGEEVVNIRNSYLISRGFSATPEVHFHSSVYQKIKTHDDSKYMTARKRFINQNYEFADRVVEECQKVLGFGIVILFENKEHGFLLKKKFDSKGIRCSLIDGSTPLSGRETARRLLVTGFIDVIIASSIWNRALDFSTPQHWFFVGGMKASNRIKQRYGRALRKKPNPENKVFIHEWWIYGNAVLEDHSFLRHQVCVSEGFQILYDDSMILDSIKEVQIRKDSKETRRKIHVDGGARVEDRIAKIFEKHGAGNPPGSACL